MLVGSRTATYVILFLIVLFEPVSIQYRYHIYTILHQPIRSYLSKSTTDIVLTDIKVIVFGIICARSSFYCYTSFLNWILDLATFDNLPRESTLR